MKKLIIISSICFAFTLSADEIVHKFKSPSFSGLGQSSHYLTIENQEKSRRDKIAQDIEDRIAKAEREANNTTLAKFLRNVESTRVFPSNQLMPAQPQPIRRELRGAGAFPL